MNPKYEVLDKGRVLATAIKEQILKYFADHYGGLAAVARDLMMIEISPNDTRRKMLKLPVQTWNNMLQHLDDHAEMFEQLEFAKMQNEVS